MPLKAGPRGTINLKNGPGICDVFVFYLPRGNKPPSKSRSLIHQTLISTKLVIRIRWPTNLVISTMVQRNGDYSSSGGCS